MATHQTAHIITGFNTLGSALTFQTSHVNI